MKANILNNILIEKGFNENNFSFYGDEIAKIKNFKSNFQNKGRLVLVTSTSPTKYGEGKTTLAISISDALNKIGKKSVVVLREPSLGPVFGLKGGATGGGEAIVLPEEDINLHFTGDIHAITSANNLLSAIIDNHIFQGNELNIEKVVHERCMDLNDRSLRHLNINGKETSFNISAASEVMAVLCLAKDEEDLKVRLGNILVGYDSQKKEVFAKDLKCINALMLLLKDAIKPNFVRTKENNLAIIHGGPFANIAHGTNSVISTNYALNNFLYTIVEAGFGSDMGALKFYDIIVRNNENLRPDVVVLNTTIQSLKYNGDEDLKSGIANLNYHIENMLRYTNNLIVVLNKHENDSLDEINFVKDFVLEKNVDFQISTGYLKGSDGSIDVAKNIMDFENVKDKDFNYVYNLNENLKSKIEKFCKESYGASEIVYNEKALKNLEQLQSSKYYSLPICIAKTQYSITDNAKILGYPKDFTMTVKDIRLFSGAGFITIYFGNILTMPGLGSCPNYLKMEE